MRAIARRYAEKTLERPNALFFGYLLGWSITIILCLALTIGAHAIYTQFRTDELILYAAAYLLFALSARTILGGMKETILFWYHLNNICRSTLHKIQGATAFFLDFFVTELLRAGGTAAFAIVAFRAALHGITLDPLLFFGTGMLIIGTFIQAIVSAAYLRWHATAQAYRRTLETDLTIQELGFLAPALRQMRSALRSRRLASLALIAYRIIDLFTYFLLAIALQYVGLLAGTGYTIMWAVFSVTAASFTLVTIMFIQHTIAEYHSWTTYSKKIILSGSSLVIATIATGALHLRYYYQSAHIESLTPLVGSAPLILLIDSIFVLLLFIFSRVLIDDWT